uniref:Uncharacterized protein n=1 Tax=Meloidogyne floridensis TaxID=298350 RepID=A0A915P5V4_9BILA
LTSSSATSSGSSHYGQSDKAVLTNSKSTHAPIQSSYPNQRRPSGGSAIIHRNTESVERITASSNTRLPQPTTKRSNSAPRGKEISKPTGKINSNTGKSTFSTPKSAGMSYTLPDTRLAKSQLSHIEKNIPPNIIPSNSLNDAYVQLFICLKDNFDNSDLRKEFLQNLNESLIFQKAGELYENRENYFVELIRDDGRKSFIDKVGELLFSEEEPR